MRKGLVDYREDDIAKALNFPLSSAAAKVAKTGL